MKDPVEDRFPSGDRPFILIHVEKSRGSTPFAQFDNLPLDIRHSAASQNIVRVVQICVFGFTNVVNSPIASRTDWLRLSSRLPSMARSRVVHTLAHASPSSTYSAWFIIESYTSVSLEPAEVDGKGPHPDRDENGTGRTQHGLDWGNVRDLLRKVQDLDGHVQRGQGIVSTFRLSRA